MEDYGIEYHKWNQEIYKYYFLEREDELDDSYLFSVDSDSIRDIGKRLGLNKNAEGSFVKNVAKYIIKQDRKSQNKLNIKDINIHTSNDTPQYTALIALFILSASMIGKSKEKYNYWNNFDNLIEKYFNNYIRRLTSEDYEKLYDIFDVFGEFISNKYEIDFSFPKLYNRGNDFIGRPIFHAMISYRDRAILSHKFYEYDKYDNKNISKQEFYNRLLDNVTDDTRYSSAFKKIKEIDDYTDLFKKKIIGIYEQWLKADRSIWEINIQTNKRELTQIHLLNAFYIHDGKFMPSITTRIYNNQKELCFDKYKLKQGQSDKYYQLFKVKDGYNIFDDHSYKIKNNLKVGNNYSSRKFILFKEDETNRCTFVESSYVQAGDKFSIIAKDDWFKDEDNLYILIKVTDDDEIENKIKQFTNGISIIHDVVAQNEDDYIIRFNTNNDIKFIKGLKPYGTPSRIYIKGAEPVIKKTEDLSYIKIDDAKCKEEFINIQKQNNELGKHKILLGDTDKIKEYTIADISEVLTNDKNKYSTIYQVLSDTDPTTQLPVEKAYICGAIINGIEFLGQNEINDKINNIENNINDEVTSLIDINDEQEEYYEAENIEQNIEENIDVKSIPSNALLQKTRYIFELIKVQKGTKEVPLYPEYKNSIINNIHKINNYKLRNEILTYLDQKFINVVRYKYLEEIRKALENG